jgi:hypothetical protein
VDKEQKCQCGRDSGLIVSAIEGRFINATLTCDGRLVTLRHLDEAISAIDGLDEYRMEQLSPGVYTLYLASQRQDRNALDKEATGILHNIYGKEAEISIVFKEYLSPEDTGKYCLAKLLFPLDINKYLDSSSVSRKN